MNAKHNTHSIFGMGIAVIAVSLAAAARPAAAQPPLLSHPAQVRQVFGGWNHNNGRGRDYDRNQDRQRAEQARREAERARHEAEARRAQWLREHRQDRDRDRDRSDSHRDSHGDWQRDTH